MARDRWEDMLSAVLQGSMQGLQSGQASGNEMKKALMLESFKAKIKQNAEDASLARLGISPGISGVITPQASTPGISDTTSNIKPQGGIIVPPKWKQIVKGGVTYVNPEQGLYEQQVANQKLLTRKNILESTNLGKATMKVESDISQRRADFGPILKDVDRVLGYWKEIPAYQKGPWDRLMPGRGLGAVSMRAGGRSIFKKNGDWYAETGLKEGKIPHKLTAEEMSRISPEEFVLGKTAAPATTYIQTKDAIMGNIAKKFAGEVGVLTKQDIDRISAMWPTQSDDDATAYRKIAGVKEFITTRVTSYEKEKLALLSQWKKRGMSEIPLSSQDLGQEEMVSSQDDILVNQLLDQLGAD